MLCTMYTAYFINGIVINYYRLLPNESTHANVMLALCTLVQVSGFQLSIVVSYGFKANAQVLATNITGLAGFAYVIL